MFGRAQIIRVGLKAFFGGGTLPVAAIVVAVAIAGISYSRGKTQAETDCRTETLEAQVAAQRGVIDRIQGQLMRAQTARDMAARTAAADAVKFTNDREAANVLIHDLTEAPHNCRLGNDVAEQLRRLGR